MSEMAVVETGTLQEIPLDEIHESPWNPRKHYDETALAELADSLRTAGQLTPALVRPRAKGGYELAAGHRRFRAAPRAGIETLLCLVRELDDQQLLEVLTVENLQRDDLHPLEEAEGFVSLMKRGGYDVAKIAHRVGRSVKYVYDRIKLLQLTPEAQELFRAGAITAGHAIILARLAPADQARAIASEKSGNGRIGGLFVHEYTLFDPRHEDEDAGEEEDGVGPRKLVSVREFQSWVDEHVRFDPVAADPMLFPETAAAVEQATEAEEKVIKITRDYRVNDEARDERERTYGRDAWKRADGTPEHEWGGQPVGGPPCDHSVLGVVVSGPGRGEAFRVCVARKKCTVHWAQEMREATKRAKAAGGNQDGGGKAKDRWELETARRREEQAKAEAERGRWERARPQLLEAVTKAIANGPAGPSSAVAEVVLDRCRGYGGKRGPAKGLPAPKTAEDVLRQAALQVLANEVLSRSWDAVTAWPRALKPFGIDARKIVDQASPKPKAPPAAKAQTSATAGKSKKKLAGDVRRAKAAAKAKKRAAA